MLRRAVRNVLSRSWPAKHDYSCRWTVNTRTWKYSSYRRWWNTRKDIPAWCTKQIYYQQLINLNVFTFVISEKKGKKRGGVSSAIPLHPQKWKIHYHHLSPLTYLFPHTYLLQLDFISKTKLYFLKTFKTFKCLKMELEIKNGHKLIARLQYLI